MHEPEQQPAEERQDEERHPRIYAASLSDYNAGVLHGIWLDADREPEELQADIEAMLAASPTTKRCGDVAEEWAIHDYEEWGPLLLGEYEPVERLTAIAAGIAEHGPAFAAWVANDTTIATEDLDQFGGVYRGEWESSAAYAEELLRDLGAYEAIDKLGGWFAPYVTIDVAALAQDLGAADLTLVDAPTGGVYVFDPR